MKKTANDTIPFTDINKKKTNFFLISTFAICYSKNVGKMSQEGKITEFQ